MQIFTETVNYVADNALEIGTAGAGYVKNVGPQPVHLYYKTRSAPTLSPIAGSEPWIVTLNQGEGVPIFISDTNSAEVLCARSAIDSYSSNVKYWEV